MGGYGRLSYQTSMGKSIRLVVVIVIVIVIVIVVVEYRFK
jgi:hypothetical protein